MSTQDQDAVAIRRIHLQRVKHGLIHQLTDDVVAIEEPLQISLQWFDSESGHSKQREWSMTMRTPGQDKDLVKGLLLTQQVISSLQDVESITYFDEDKRHAGNHLLVILKDHIQPDWQLLERSYISQSSCGICGVTSMRSLCLRRPVNVDQQPGWLSVDSILSMPEQLKDGQGLFAKTGAMHGAGYWVDHQLVCVAEDVGRHNAVDKLLGQIFSSSLWRPQGVLVLSGRVSFELMQKAMIAGIAVIVSVGAPSSLAVDMAKQFDMTLVGFIKGDRFNIYNGHWRLQLPSST
ncbi:MAG: Sulfur carrier protein FdhD [Candidatus Celerinatantimonas neptuna]|nr:MAG: Sulfur carrier protein FdhD [Candidatus Celerinatantimonas neptuna]